MKTMLVAAVAAVGLLTAMPCFADIGDVPEMLSAKGVRAPENTGAPPGERGVNSNTADGGDYEQNVTTAEGGDYEAHVKTAAGGDYELPGTVADGGDYVQKTRTA